MRRVLITVLMFCFALLAQGETYTYETSAIFHGNGGMVSYQGSTPCEFVEVKGIQQVDTYYCNPSEVSATRLGFRFDKWYQNAQATTPCILKPNGGITIGNAAGAHRDIYAGWIEAAYFIVFHENDGSGTMGAQKMQTGIAATIASNQFTRANYRFVGWAETAGGAVKYPDGGSVCLSQDPPYNEAEQRYEYDLYAIWKEADYPVVYCSNDEQNSFKTNAVPLSTSVILSNPFKRQGYSFASWNTRADGNGETYDAGNECVYIAAKYPEGLFLYAQWVADTYRVTFNGKGGTPTSTWIDVLYDSPYGALPTCERDGYRFLGWFTAETEGDLVESTTVFHRTTSQTLYAHWAAKSYEVTLDPNGGTPSEPATTNVVYDAPYGELPTSARTGYDFAGWWTTATGGTLVSSNTVFRTAGDVTLYAHWTAHTYTVAFDRNGGTGGSTSSQTGTYDKPLVLQGNGFTRPGYSFAEWEMTNGVRFADRATVTNLASEAGATVTLYALWQANTYRVSFTGNGGGTPSVPSIDVVYGTLYGTLPTCERNGYRFVGWFTSSSGGDQITETTAVTITSAQTLYAHWAAKSYEVTLDPNGGTPPEPATTNVVYGTAYGELPACTRTGYSFDNWWTAATGGTRIYANTLFQETTNKTLYAHWKVHAYAVAFDPNGGEGTMGKLTGKEYDTVFLLPSNAFTRVGYDFVGWAMTNGVTFADGEAVSNLTALAGVTEVLIAQWQAKTFTVTFDFTGGTGTPAAKEVTYDSMYGDLPTPERGYFVFNGWYTAATNGVQVTATNKVTITADQTLYAQWTPPREFTIRFDSCGGNAVEGLLTVTEGGTYGTLPADPARFGYVFDGWFSKKTGGTKIVAESALVVQDDHTLYAHWTKLTSDLSTALDTRDFYFVSDTTSAWFVTNLTGTVNGSCLAVRGVGTSLGEPAVLFTQRESPVSGTLTFDWRIAFFDPDVTDDAKISLVLEDEAGVALATVSRKPQMANFAAEEIKVPTNCVKILFKYYCDAGLKTKLVHYAFLDNLKWTPDDAPASIEVEGASGVTVTGDAASGFVVTLPSDVDPADVTVKVSLMAKAVTVPIGVKLCLLKGAYDLTEYLTLPSPDDQGRIDLTQAQVKDEIVKAALSGMVLNAENPQLTIAETIPGLTYVFRQGTDLTALFSSRPQVQSGDGNSWEPEITTADASAAFFSLAITPFDVDE